MAKLIDLENIDAIPAEELKELAGLLSGALLRKAHALEQAAQEVVLAVTGKAVPEMFSQTDIARFARRHGYSRYAAKQARRYLTCAVIAYARALNEDTLLASFYEPYVGYTFRSRFVHAQFVRDELAQRSHTEAKKLLWAFLQQHELVPGTETVE